MTSRPAMQHTGDATTRGRASARSLVTFFGLAYVITWGLILGFLATKSFRLSEISLADGFVMFLFMLAGPSTSGLLLTWRESGRTGLAEIAGRARRWRVPGEWLAIALGTNPVVFLAILVSMAALVSPAYAPGFQPIGLVIGLLAGAIEEIGWTGFATPRLLSRLSPLRAGLLLGILWASWHGLADFAGNIDSQGAHWLPYFLVYWLVTLTAYRVLMTFVYAHTRSLLVAMLMHASYTGWQFTLSPGTTLDQSFVWQLVLAVVMVSVAAAVAIREGRHREVRQSVPSTTGLPA